MKLLTDECEALKQAVSEGMIMVGKDSLYRFAHDQIWQAAYSLIPDDEKNTTRLNVGKRLWQKCSNAKLEDFIFIIANLLNTAPEFVYDKKERTQMAKIFLKAGEKSKSSAAFKSSSMYLATGIKFLKPSDWKENYELSLKLYSAASEAAYCQMNYSLMDERIEHVMQNATAVMDKIPCYLLIIRAFTDRRKHEEAISIGLEALDELGEHFPIKPDASLVLNLIKEAKVLLMNVSDWNSVDKMTNASALTSMQILSDLYTACYFARPASLFPLVAIRMVHLTLEHGISVHSATGFSLFAGILSRNYQNFKYGNHVGNLALLLLEKFSTKESTVNVNIVMHNLVTWQSEHISSVMKPLLNTYKVALEIGNYAKTEMLFNHYCYAMFMSGQPMASFEYGITPLMETRFLNKTIPMTIKKMISIFVFSETRDPMILIKEIKEEFSSCDDPAKSFAIYIFGLIAAIYFRQYEKALKLIEAMPPSHHLIGTYPSVVHEFFVGLVSLSIAKSSAEKCKLISIANECIEKLKKWSMNCPENFLNKLTLLQAELSAVNEDESLTIQLYVQSINLAKKSKFIHEEALACEKVAMYLFEKKKENNAHHFLLRAYEAYFQWGATAKMNHLRSLYPSLLDAFNSFHSSFSRITGIPVDICLSASAESVSEVSEWHRSIISGSNRARKRARTS